MQIPSVRSYRFAQFTLDLSRRRLLGSDAGPLQLSGRGYDVLVYLVANRERMVPKGELMDAVWPGAAVEENNLAQAISGLRRALGDTRESPQFIATVAGRGYQFVAVVHELQELPTDASTPSARPPTARSRWIVAVMLLAGAALAAVVLFVMARP